MIEIFAVLLASQILANELRQAAQLANSLAHRSEALVRKLEGFAC